MRATRFFYPAIALSLLFVGVTSTPAQTAAAKPTIVLVHGAFADASSFQYLIPLLLNDGYNVVAVQNPLSSAPDDIATTKRLIDAQKGPVVVVGHSYGGLVISAAASGNPNVKALVYLAAFAPEANEPVGPLRHPEAGSQLGIRRYDQFAGVEDHSVVVSGVAPGSRAESGSRALLCQAYGREDQ